MQSIVDWFVISSILGLICLCGVFWRKIPVLHLGPWLLVGLFVGLLTFHDIRPLSSKLYDWLVLGAIAYAVAWLGHFESRKWFDGD